MCSGCPLQFSNAHFLFSDALAGGEHGQQHGLQPQGVKLAGARFIQFAAERGLDNGIKRFCRPWLHDSLHTSAQAMAQVAYFNIFPPFLALQMADVLP